MASTTCSNAVSQTSTKEVGQKEVAKLIAPRGRPGICSTVAPIQHPTSTTQRIRNLSEECVLPPRHSDCSPSKVVMRPQGTYPLRAGNSTPALTPLHSPSASRCTPIVRSSLCAEENVRMISYRHEPAAVVVRRPSSLSPSPECSARSHVPDRQETAYGGGLLSHRCMPRIAVSPLTERSTRMHVIDRPEASHGSMPSDRYAHRVTVSPPSERSARTSVPDRQETAYGVLPSERYAAKGLVSRPRETSGRARSADRQEPYGAQPNDRCVQKTFSTVAPIPDWPVRKAHVERHELFEGLLVESKLSERRSSRSPSPTARAGWASSPAGGGQAAVTRMRSSALPSPSLSLSPTPSLPTAVPTSMRTSCPGASLNMRTRARSPPNLGAQGARPLSPAAWSSASTPQLSHVYNHPASRTERPTIVIETTVPSGVPTACGKKA